MIFYPDSCMTLWPLQSDGSPGLGRRGPPQGHQRGAARLAHPPAHGELPRDVAEVGQGGLRGETAHGGGGFFEEVGLLGYASRFLARVFNQSQLVTGTAQARLSIPTTATEISQEAAARTRA